MIDGKIIDIAPPCVQKTLDKAFREAKVTPKFEDGRITLHTEIMWPNVQSLIDLYERIYLERQHWKSRKLTYRYGKNKQKWR